MSQQVQVLVVEDDGLIRMDLADILTDHGFSVLEAMNAEQALAMLEAQPAIRVVLTDIDMPGAMNGLSLANAAAEQWPDCRIIVISGRYVPEDGSLPEGARFLSKPISERQLAATLIDLGMAT